MAELVQGYPIGVTYVKYVTNKLSPAHINFCLLMSGTGVKDLCSPLPMPNWAQASVFPFIHAASPYKQQVTRPSWVRLCAHLNSAKKYFVKRPLYAS
jgi:hypothetical protein